MVNELHLPVYSSQFNINKFYQQSDYGLKLRPEYACQTKQHQETQLKFKGPPVFGNHYFQHSLQYLPIGYFAQDDYFYKLIIYTAYGKSDTEHVNLQLNSYDKQGQLIDTIILDSQYSYEGMSSYTGFRINPDMTIKFTQHITYYFSDDYEYGDERGLIKNPQPEKYMQEKYQIYKGHFNLIYSKNILMFNQKTLSILILFCKYQAKIKMILGKLLLLIFDYNNSIILITIISGRCH